MLKQLKRKNPPTVKPPETGAESITCGACGEVREPGATSPEWQCSCCGKAYAKVNAENEAEKVSQEELRRLNRQYLKRKKRAERPVLSSSQSGQVNEHIQTGLLTGGFLSFTGMSKVVGTCVKTVVPANPVLQIAGAVIIAGTLLYAAMKYLG